MNFRVLFLILALSSLHVNILTEATVSKEPCSFRITYYKEENCPKNGVSYTTLLSVSHNNDNNETACQFIQDAFYQTSCSSHGNLVLQPCADTIDTAFLLQRNNRTLIPGECYSGVTDPTKLQVSFQLTGSCADNNTDMACSQDYSLPELNKKAPTNNAPKIQPIRSIQIPSPPLPSNHFADQMQTLQLFHEMVHLSATTYKIINDDIDPASVWPGRYTLHLWSDGFSTDYAVLTSETTQQEQGKIYVVFRGTDETLDGDWITNANVPKGPFGPPGGVIEATVNATNMFGDMETFELQVHRGFNSVFSNNAYMKIINIITPFLQRKDDHGNLYYNNSVYFAGHSLGGANAQLLGTYYAVLNPHINTYVTTLGSPKQGNYAYKLLGESLTNLSVWRLVLCRDVVPRIPLIQYYHSGHIMWKRCIDQPWGDRFDVVDKDDLVQAYYRQAGDEDQGYADLPQSWMIQYNEPTIISDHFAGAYMNWIEGHLLDDTLHFPSVFEKIQPASSLPPVESPNAAPTLLHPITDESSVSSGVQHVQYRFAFFCILSAAWNIFLH